MRYKCGDIGDEFDDDECGDDGECSDICDGCTLFIMVVMRMARVTMGVTMCVVMVLVSVVANTMMNLVLTMMTPLPQKDRPASGGLGPLSPPLEAKRACPVLVRRCNVNYVWPVNELLLLIYLVCAIHRGIEELTGGRKGGSENTSRCTFQL